MSRGKFDRIMYMVEIASNAKVGRLSDTEFRCMLTGVWPLAAKSPIRGCLLVGDLEVEPADVARQGRCSTAVAGRTLKKMRDLGMLERDDELGCERVHDWDEINPAPKTDPNAARRQALHRDPALRRTVRERDGDRCRYCNVGVRWTDRRGQHGGTYDHVDPTGPNAVWNLVVACRACNARKCNRAIEEAGMELLPEPKSGSKSELGPTSSVLSRTRSEVEVEVEREEEEKKNLGGGINENARPPAATVPTGFLKKIDGGRPR